MVLGRVLSKSFIFDTRRRTFWSLGITSFLLIGGGISYLLSPWGGAKRSGEELRGAKDDQGGTERVEPIIVTETLQRAKSDNVLVLKVPNEIGKLISERMAMPEGMGPPFDNIHYEVLTVDGKTVEIYHVGAPGASLEITNKAFGIDKRFAYRFEIKTPVSEPAPEGWRLEGSIVVSVSDGREFVIDFSAQIRFKANPTPGFSKTVNAESATVTWRWPGTAEAGKNAAAK
jgi:hypothetical protein